MLGSGGGVQQDVALDADFLDQVELALDEIDVLFFAFQDAQQHLTRHEVARAFAIGDARTQIVQCLFFEAEVGLQDFLDSVLDVDAAGDPSMDDVQLLAPSLSGENDVCSVAVCAAPALAGSAQQTSSTAVTALILDIKLPRSRFCCLLRWTSCRSGAR